MKTIHTIDKDADYITYYSTTAEYNAALSKFLVPNVSFTDDNDVVHYNPSPLNVITYQATEKLTEAIVKPYPTDGLHTNAFSGSSGQQLTMESHTFENGVGTIEFDGAIASIGKEAFNGCSGLTSVTIPNSVTSIGRYAFANCSGLTSITIHNSVTSIGDYAFSSCSSLTSITIPNSVTSIGDYAFGGCSSLTSINVNSGNTVYDSRNNCNAIIETETNTLVQGCKTTIILDSVTSIGDRAFYNCSGLTSIEIPDSVTSIGDYAFDNCSGLTSITIPNSVTSIGNVAFNSCSSLTSVTIPSGVTSIGDSAFNSCSSLTSVTIGNGVTSIGIAAFSYCRSLTSVTIGNGVTSISQSAFYNCSSLTSITSLSTTAPTISSYAFQDIKINGTLYVPSGSSGYDVWMGTGNYYLGKYGWTKVEQ